MKCPHVFAFLLLTPSPRSCLLPLFVTLQSHLSLSIPRIIRWTAAVWEWERFLVSRPSEVFSQTPSKNLSFLKRDQMVQIIPIWVQGVGRSERVIWFEPIVNLWKVWSRCGKPVRVTAWFCCAPAVSALLLFVPLRVDWHSIRHLFFELHHHSKFN